MIWAQAGIEDSAPSFHENFETVDTILMGHGTYEDLSTKWPYVKDWPAVDDVSLRLGEIINNTPKVVVAGGGGIADISGVTSSRPSSSLDPTSSSRSRPSKNERAAISSRSAAPSSFGP